MALAPIDLDVAIRMSGDVEFAREWVAMTDARIAELEAMLRRIDAVVTWETTSLGRQFQDEVESVLGKTT